MRPLKWLLTLPLILLLLVFALSNRDVANLSFWPFDLAISMPLSFMLVACLVIGLLLGGFTVWLGDLKDKIEVRCLRNEVTNLNRQILSLQQSAAPKPAVAPTPMLSFKRRFKLPTLDR